jgi:carboxylesterase
MGGSLTLRLAERHGDAIHGIVLVNPAVHSERPDRFLLPVLQAVVPSFPGISNDIKKPGQDEGAYDKIPLKAAHSLSKLWKIIKADIAAVQQPLLLFRSAEDHVVEASNAAFILDHVSSVDKTEVVLPDSYHVATLDNDAETIVTGSIDFVRRLS